MPIVPMLAYQDAPTAIDFLCNAFGFTEVYRMQMDDGRIGYAELSFAGAALCLSSVYPEMGFCAAREANGTYSQLQIEVDDVDAHYERARQAGAIVAAPPEDQPYGGRMYRAVDPEGHRWIFTTPSSLSPDEVKAAYGAS